jgi:8-oxo-dGTP diphosphatase
MTDIIEKVGAIIIENRHLLLVSGNNKSFYWTPGGKIEKEESPEQALQRELTEELSVKANDLKPYFEYLSKNEEDGRVRKVFCFLVAYEGEINQNNEIDRTLWLTKKDYLNNIFPIQMGVSIHLIPKLIEDNLL